MSYVKTTIKQNSQRLTSYSQWFSVAIFLFVLVVGGTVFMLSMGHIVRTNKHNTLARILDNERIKLEIPMSDKIHTLLAMADNPHIRAYMANPHNPEIKRAALVEIDGFSKAFLNDQIFWVSDADKRFYLDGSFVYNVVPNLTENYWYDLTLYHTESYNFNINYNPDLNDIRVWVNVPVFHPTDSARAVGMIGSGIEISTFVNTIYGNYKGNAELYFMNALGDITAARDTALVTARENIVNYFGGIGEAILQSTFYLREDEIHTISTPLGEIGITRIPTLEWYVFAIIPDQLSDYVDSMLWLFLSMLAMMGIVLIVLNVFVIKAEFKSVKDATEKRIEAILDKTPLSVVLFGRDLKVIQCNMDAVKIHEFTSKQEFYDNFEATMPQYQPSGQLSTLALADIMSVAFEDGYHKCDWLHYTKDMQPLPLECICVRLKHGDDFEVVVYARDMREHNSMLEELRKKDMAEAQNKAKSDFLAKMSHEMRTPMNAIIGMADIALRKEMPPSVRDDVLTIKNAGTNLLILINDILDLSKIESGKLEIIPGRYEFSSLVNDVVSIIKVKMEGSGLALNIDIDDSIPNKLTGDSVRIRQILLNILTNAVKYTEEGSITFSVRGETKDSETCVLTMEVSDTGKGIREDDVRKLFSDFVQVDTITNRGIEGTGLGLSIAKNLARAMGGDIKVKSVYGEGSTFTVTLPQKIRSHEAASLTLAGYDKSQPQLPEENFTAPTARILIVDDIVTNIKVAVGLLEPYGMTIDTATSGMEAIGFVRGHRYDMILMDHMMPGLDGTETVRRIREMGEIESELQHLRDVPIIALTANAVTGAKDMFLQNGFSDFLSKPIDIVKLNSILEYWIPNEKKSDVVVSHTPDDIDISGVRLPGVDINLGVARNGGKVYSYLSTLDIFCFDVKMKIDEIVNALNTNDIALFTIYVHALKSALANIGASELSALAKELEDAGNRMDKAFIDENVNDLLTRLRLLLENIGDVLQTIKAKHDQSHVVDADTSALKSILSQLFIAIDNVEPAAITSTLKQLEPYENGFDAGVDDATKSKVRAIKLHVLNGEYDEAEALIQEF